MKDIKKVIVDKMPFQVSQRRIQDLLEDRSIDIPEHQRPYVWDAKRGSAFLDTIMKSLPTHAVFLYQTISNGEIKRYIEDGQQRFMTIKFFVTKDDRGKHLRWSGKQFEEFTFAEQAILNNYMITVNTMENIPQDDRIMLFQRLQEGKPLTSGQRFAALADKPLVRLAKRIMEDERCHAIWGNHKETSSRTVLSNAMAIAAGLCLPNDNHITSSYEIIGPEIFANPTIDEDLANQRLTRLIEVYSLADELCPSLTMVQKKKQWKVGQYTGYILYTMRQPGRNWETDKQMWAEYLARVRRDSSAEFILYDNKPSSRNWNRERWAQGLWNLENPDEVLERIRNNNADSVSISDED